MQYVEAPTDHTADRPAVFLAGGITGCPDWQADAVRLLTAELAGYDAAVLNPRRADFPIADAGAAEEQIGWEFRHLRLARVVLFWFPAGPAVQPIALYELGFHAGNPDKRIAVGCDPAYVRAADVHHQMRLVRPGLPVRDTLARTCADVRYQYR